MSSVLEVRGVAVSIGKTRVLQDITFSLAKGEALVVVGPSGCGKTTLLRALMGLQKHSGTVDMDPDVRGEGIGYIDQRAHLLPWRTLRQNAALALELRGCLDRDTLAGVDALIDQYGLWDDRYKLSAELSGGMAQRVAVIRALAAKPGILFCDEPFSAIDFVARLELNGLFRSNCRVRGISTVFVTHNIEEAIFLADRIIVLGGTPARITGSVLEVTDLGARREDPVAIRRSTGFQTLFDQIWHELNHARLFRR